MVRKTTLLASISLSVMLAAASNPAFTKESKYVYTWVGSDNVRHYSERPPKGIKATRIKTSVGKQKAKAEQAEISDAAKEVDADEAIPHDQKVLAEAKPKKDKDVCKRARHNFQILNERARIKIKDEGATEARFLTEKEVSEQKTAAKDAIDVYC